MSGQQKLSSRLSSLNMFGKFTTSSNKPPPPIEKDPWYQTPGSKSAVSLVPSQALSMHTSSIACMSVETLQLPQMPLSTNPISRTMSPVSARSRTTTFTSSTAAHSQASEMSSFRRGISKLSSSFGKKSKLFLRSNASRATLNIDSKRSSEDGMSDDLDHDGGISRPWNVKHDLHVDEGLANLPPEWMNKLREEGFKDTDVLSIQSRRNRTTYLKNHPDVSVDVLRARSNSPHTPTSTSVSPSLLSPLPKSALPTRSTSLRRPSAAADVSDSTSVTTSGRSGGSSRSPDSTSPPSSYGFSSSGVPSFGSSVSSRAPSLYTNGDTTDDDYSDPGTATASQFGGVSVSGAPPPASSVSSSASRGLPRMDNAEGDPPIRTPPSRAATLTFVVTNPTPPSPPPAYEPGTAQMHTFPRDEKRDSDDSNPQRDDERRGSTSAEGLPERRSEETLTPEVLMRNENNDSAQVNCASPTDMTSQTTRETSDSPPPFRLHISKPSRDGSSTPSPPESPIVSRTAAAAPRLSLHQDDLSSWSAALFSVLGTPDPESGSLADAQSSSTPDAFAPTSKPTIDTSVASASSSRVTSPKTKKAPSPLVLSPPSKDIPRVTIETDEDDRVEVGFDSLEHGAGTTSTTPLFNELLSLVTPATKVSTSEQDKASPLPSPPLTSTYPYLPSPPPVSSPQRPSSQVNAQLSHAQSPNKTLEFLKESYDPHRDSTVSSSAGSRESQMTISASSRWSRATTIRDVRDATIAVAHVRKPSVANAMTVPAPAPSRHNAQQSVSTVQSGASSGDGSGRGSRPLSAGSSDGVSAADFPLPPPSPGDFSISSVQPSPMSGKFSLVSDDVRLPYTASDNASPLPSPNRMSSPASTRSSQSSEGSGASSSSSSQVNPLSITSASDEGPEQHGAGAVHVELRYNDGNVLSPTDSTMSELDAAKWAADQKKLSPPALMCITPQIYTSSTDDSEDAAQDRDGCCDRGSDVPDGASGVVEWLEDAPSPHFDLKEKPLRDSGTLYNLVGEPSPRPSPSPNPSTNHNLSPNPSPSVNLHPSSAAVAVAADKDREGSPSPQSQPQVRRPSLQINGIETLGVPGSPIPSPGRDKPLPRLSPASALSDPSPMSSSSTSPSSATPSPSPLQRYRGWVSEVVAPLEEFIDHTVDPRELFTDLQEIAEGESGSVFSARVAPLPLQKSKAAMRKREGKVAVKQIPLLPGGSPKLEELRKELMLVSRVSHTNILSMDALYVDLVEDALWIEMELMERSLADILALVGDGLVLGEEVIARFTSDILSALAHLETLGIVHRDVRSDNLLVNSQGVLKLADFSSALLVDSTYPTYTDPAGVIYWQAPEVRRGSYDARKVDVWSAGATAWEMVESEPPFMNMNIEDPQQFPDRWPAPSQSDSTTSSATTYSRSFHDFLTLCSNPPSSRPSAHDLLMTPFIRSSCARSLIVDLLAQCKSIEERVLRRTSSDSQGTVLS